MAVEIAFDKKLKTRVVIPLLLIQFCFWIFLPASYADTKSASNVPLVPFQQAQSIHVAYSKRSPNIVRGDDILLEETKYAFRNAGFQIEPIRDRADLILELFGAKEYSYEYFYTVVGNQPERLKAGIEVTIEAVVYRQDSNIYRISSDANIREKLPKVSSSRRPLDYKLENEAEAVAIDGLNAKLADLLNLVSKHQKETERQ